MKSVKEFYDEKIAKIDWFSNCGNEINIITNLDFIHVNKWRDVEKNINSNWDNLKLHIRNSLTSSLHENWREEYREWNNITLEAKSLLKNGVLNELSTFIQENKLKNSVYESVEWDLLTAMMEYAYSPYVKLGFHTELFKVYESGHIPCGWKGKWPQGSLLIF
ncbi:hypothetical protein [Paenibacillus glacialis]|uniref:Uncharacterized protein n=1 Tax=Paenibacillus glacialis TaxID=494026 RepID=A0A168I493_9BACL|nr:hypothetical protein [Paenibacillus glacialis]OAB38851.1 hypothetical protein PGLA_19540 [Paenibacillus glacialis]